MFPNQSDIFSLFLVHDACLRSYFKNSWLVFHRGSKHSKTIKALGLRPRAFISFLVFGNPDETLALVFEILLLTVFQI